MSIAAIDADGLVEAIVGRVVALLETKATGSSPWMTAAEAAAYLRFPLKRIYNLTQTDQIPHRRQEGRLLFHRDELDAWLNCFYSGPPRLDL